MKVRVCYSVTQDDKAMLLMQFSVREASRGIFVIALSVALVGGG